MKRILLLLCVLALMLGACRTQPEPETKVETTTTAIATTEDGATITEDTATTAISTTKKPARQLTTIRPPSDPPPRTNENDKPIMFYKPVIYLYPQQPTQVDVTLTPPNASFTQTIPAYNTGWHVLAQPNGQLKNLADDKTYPYLFWEAMERNPWPEAKEGFVVARGDLEDFLREKLAFMGLISIEYEEFIEFWAPLLAQNEYSLITFAGEEYSARFPLEITPKPDSMLRVFMVARPATGREKIATQTLKPFARNGFAVIEWGGTLLD